MSSLATTLFIGRRYALGRRRARFGYLVRLFSFLAMTLGVAALILVLSVMNGFRQEMSERFLRILPQATLYPAEHESPTWLNDDTVILAWSPVSEEIAQLSAGPAQAMATLTAIDPLREPAVIDLESLLIEGDLAAFREQRFGILLGAQMARDLQLRTGDNLRVTLPSYQILPTGIYPRVKNFVVAGIYTSASQLDGELAFIRQEDAQPLFRGIAARTGIRLRLADPAQHGSALLELADRGELQWWQQRLNGLYEAMQMEKLVVSLMLLAVIFVAAFSLVASLMMSVGEKRTDIAVLRTLGASSPTILGAFLLQGLLFGGVGIAFGALVGTLLAIFMADISRLMERLLGATFFDPGVFYISYLPSQWQLSDLLLVTGAALLIALLAALLPAWRASRVAPAEAIHYNH